LKSSRHRIAGDRSPAASVISFFHPDTGSASKRLPIAVGVILLIGFCSFLPYLNSYPEPFFDEAIFNNPAVRVHDGHSFEWPLATVTPYGNLVWAYHGPFYPRMQVLTMRLLGVSQFACRLPQYAAAFAAVGILCWLLYGRGLQWGALGLAICWLGDRSLIEALYGRMDGLALLCLALAFVAFVKALETKTMWPVFWSGLGAATAVGFHPCTAPFAAMLIAAYLWRLPGRRLRALCLLAVAAAIPALLVLATVAPHFREALAQFLFHRRTAAANPMLRLAMALNWSRYWCVALLCVSGVLAIPVLAVSLKPVKDENRPESNLFLAASLYSIAALVSLAGTAATTALYPYYFIYLSVWPVVAVIAALEQRADRLWIRRAGLVCLTLLAVAWIPSAMWNLMRWREAALYVRGSLSQAFERQVRAVVPPGAELKISAELFIVGRSLGPDAVRAPYDNALRLPSSAWLALIGKDIARLDGLEAPGLGERPIVYRGSLYPWIAKYSDSLIILGPLAQPGLPGAESGRENQAAAGNTVSAVSKPRAWQWRFGPGALGARKRDSVPEASCDEVL
jgi:hypothetical protein